MLEAKIPQNSDDNGPSRSAAVCGGGSYSVFQESWWLDAVAPDQWDEVTIESGGKMIGRFPYVLERRNRRTYLKIPAVNQYLGPWIDSGEGKYVTRLTKQHEILERLIDQLPPFDSFDQKFSPNITNWLPFYWKGFEATVRYTYRIEELNDLDAVWKETRDNMRTDVRKAERTLTVRDDLGIDRFMETLEKTFQRQSIKQPYSRELIARIDEACRNRNAGKAMFAVDAQERIHAVVYFIWSRQTFFYLLSGADPELRSSGATSYLVWEGIKLAQTVSASFDFEGSMIPGVERFARSFGARQTPYFRIAKRGRWMQARASLSSAWRAIRGQ